VDNMPKPHVGTLVYAIIIVVVVLFVYHLVLGKKG
jgi:hypothetical protein